MSAPAPAADRPLPSIRNRVGRAALAMTVAWTLAAAGAVGLVVRTAVDDWMDQALQESAELLYGLLSLPASADVLAQHPGSALPAPPHHETLVWQVVSARRQVLLHSHGAPATPWLPAPTPGHADAAGGAWRVYGLALPGREGQVLYVAQPAGERRRARWSATLLSALAALVVGGLGAAWLRWQVRRELQPLTELSDAVSTLDPLQPAVPLPAARRAELRPLAQALAALGERTRQRLASERAFTAHAAHALRTPLAGIDAQLAVAVRQAPPALQERLTQTRGAAQRLQHVVVALLALFRSSAEPQRRRVDLAALAQRLPVAGLQVHADAAAAVDADPDLLAAALANLLDNAARCGAHQVWLSAARGTGSQRLLVRDDGPGIAAELRTRLLDELQPARYQRPLGLGLMLADVVARAHGGRLDLPEPAAGATGTTVLLDLGPAGG